MILLLLLLASCGPRIDPVVPGFRAPDAPIYSSAVVETARLSGHWVQVAGFAAGGQAVCGPGSVDFDGGDFDGGAVRWDLCLADGRHNGAGPLVPGKPGRFGVAGMADWWVLWVDGDYRTLVIGTPSGAFGFVLNRDAGMPGDRLQAVRDIVRFNGYDPANMAVF